uniref:Reverse transcriptase n=1 Tax=Trichuris muris TaxID=70415 RepID=A0A5S6Q481_TRIMR
MSREQRSGTRGGGQKGKVSPAYEPIVAVDEHEAPSSATTGDRGRTCDSLEPLGTGIAGNMVLPALSADTRNAGHWFDRLEDYFDLMDVPSAKKVPLVKFYLDESLRQALPALGISPTDDYLTVRQKLTSYLGGEKDPRIWRGHFFARMQMRGERIATFMVELRRLAMLAFPQLPERERDALVIEQFGCGLLSVPLRAAVTRTMYVNRRGTGLGDLRRKRLATEDTREVRREHIERLTAAIQLLATGGSAADCANQGRNPQTLGKVTSKVMHCFHCGERGHKRRDCPIASLEADAVRKQNVAPSSQGRFPRASSSGGRSVVPLIAVPQLDTTKAVSVRGYLGANRIVLLVDTGAAVSIVREDSLPKCQVTRTLLDSTHVICAGGTALKIKGTVSIDVKFDGIETIRHDMLVAENLTCPCLLGADFLRLHRCVIDLSKGMLHIRGRSVALTSEDVHDMVADAVKHKPLEMSRKSFCEIIEPMIPEVGSENKEKLADLQRLLWEMREAVVLHHKRSADISAVPGGNIGRTFMVKHKIKTGNAKPVRVPPRRIPYARRQEVKTLVNQMLQEGIVEPACSPWSAPIVLVRKKDGSQRLCVDYRQLNAVTEKDAQPMPRIDETLDMLAGAKWFSTLDLASGYWQVEMEEADKQKTAFSTPDGSYQFRVMPFGLCNAPATFQRLMSKVLGSLQGSACLVYLDDIIVFGGTEDEHLERLRKVLECLKCAGLKVKPSKCKLLRREVVPRKGKFVKNFAEIAGPLHQLLRKDSSWEWSADCRESFLTLKKALVSSPVLRLPDLCRPFVLDVDASSESLGAVLAQSYEDGEHPVAYASRSLSRAERNYCATRRELLAVVWAVEHFRPYVYGVKFTVRTDHNCLIWLKNFKEPQGQPARWIERLAEFDMKVEHRPGKRHANADAMSRRPCKQCSDGPEFLRQEHQVSQVTVA